MLPLSLKKLDNLRVNEPLAPHTTFKIGGLAKFFYQASSEDDLIEAVKAARLSKIPYFILGGGSNILVSDQGFKGLVIRARNKNYQIKKNRQGAIITAEAGLELGRLINFSIEAGLTGLEWAVGIPGTVGGAVRGNAGAFGGSMDKAVKRVWVLRGGRQILIDDYQEQSSYRESFFKQEKNSKDIILKAELRLSKGDKEESRKIIREYLEQRRSSQPYDFPSAGCIFKNSQLATHNLKRLLNRCPGAEQFVAKKIVPAGWLIDRCGLKGKQIGGAMISLKHANFIVNAGGAKSKDVVKLIKFIKHQIQKKYGILMEKEIQYVGFTQSCEEAS